MNAEPTPSYFVIISSLATGRNPEVVAEMSPAERARVFVEALMFIALLALVFAQWSALIGSETTARGYVGAAVFTILFLGFDYVLGAAIERQAAQGGRTWLTNLSIVTRLAMSAVGATVLSTAWALNKFSPEIDTRNRADAAAANVSLRSRYDARVSEQQRRLLAPIEASIKAMQAERETANASMAALQATARAQNEAATAAIQEATRQDYGVHGAEAGQGRLYRFAIAQKNVALDAAAREAAAAESERARVSAVDMELKSLENHRVAAIAKVDKVEHELRREMVADPEYVTVGTDFLSRFRGLRKLMADPRDGLSVTLMLLAIWALFVTLELAYLLSKLAHQGMTYAPRDMLRERRDLERWAQNIRLEMVADTAAFRLRMSDLQPATGQSEREVPGSRDFKVIELRPKPRNNEERE